METTTETNPDNRELTPTEIKIAIAEIEDRLARFVNAAKDENFLIQGDEEYEDLDEKIQENRQKYGIPEGVHLMGVCAINDHDIAPFMQFAKWWVKGEWTDEIADLFLFHFCEINEVDFYWVLMDEPGNYYCLGIDLPEDRNEEIEYDDRFGYVKLEPELKRIGMRSRKKATMNFKLHMASHGWSKK